MNNENETRLIEHLVSIVEMVTQEVKELKNAVNATDKDLALIDQRLKYAEELVERIRKLQNEERLTLAKQTGGDVVKWGMLGVLATGSVGVVFKLIYDAFKG